jgi:hypothetical protein
MDKQIYKDAYLFERKVKSKAVSVTGRGGL